MTFPATALPIVVQAWLGSTLGWVDVPTRTEAAGGGVKIKRDRRPGAALPDPGTCTITVDNTSGDWSPRNPRGAYYGLLGRNTPIRVSFDGGSTFRFVGEVSSWAPRWSLSGRDRYVPVVASGILRRLSAASVPARSPMRRAYVASGPVAYWSLEDGLSAQQAGSALPGHPPLDLAGSATFVDVADYTWSTASYATIRFGTSKVVELKNGASLSGSVPASVTAATSSAWTVAVSAMTDYHYTSGDVVLLDVATPNGTFIRWQLIQRNAALDIDLVAYNGAGVPTTVATESGLYTTFMQLNISAWQNGANINVAIDTFGNVDGSLGHGATGSVAGTLTGITAVAVNSTGATSSDTMPFGHLAVWAANEIPTSLVNAYGTDRPYGPIYSQWREPATVRLARLCSEEGVPLDMPAVDPADEQMMGWQPVATFAELLQQCVEADGGLLLEARDALGLVYRPRTTLYNQTPAVVLDYAAGHIADPFQPVDDDDQVVNDVTVERAEGSTVRVQLVDGPLSVQPPPDGIGAYEQQAKLNLLDDSQLADRASWLLHLGTVDAARYEQVRVLLDGAALAADPTRSAAVAAADAGDVLQLDELPAWLPPGPELVMVYGYEEQADSFAWSITWTAGPGSPWTVGVADAGQRASAGGATLATAITATSTTLQLTAPDGGAVWTTDPADFPLDLLVGGELVTLSGITGSSSPWTATVSARAVNGVIRGWPAGTAVDVSQPVVAAL